jgi:hypothetical protein
VGTLASVFDFDRCYIAGSVALGFGDEFFSTANDAARTMARFGLLGWLGTASFGSLGADGPLLGAALVGWRGVAA